MIPPVPPTSANPEDWYAGFDADLADACRAAGRRRTFADGESIYTQGDEPDGLYGVVAGQVRLVSYNAEGDAHLLLIARAGRWFGEMSTLDGQARQQDAICTGAVTVLHLASYDLEQLGRLDGRLWRSIGALATHHQRMALDYMRALVQLPVAGRVLALLTLLADADDRAAVEITNEQIASSVGACRQSVNKALGLLRAKGLICQSYGKIILMRHQDGSPNG